MTKRKKEKVIKENSMSLEGLENAFLVREAMAGKKALSITVDSAACSGSANTPNLAGDPLVEANSVQEEFPCLKPSKPHSAQIDASSCQVKPACSTPFNLVVDNGTGGAVAAAPSVGGPVAGQRLLYLQQKWPSCKRLSGEV